MADSVAWGRVALTGGTDWPTLGRKDKEGKKASNLDRPDLETPNLLRSVLNVAFSRIFTSHSGCHAVLLTPEGRPYLFGRNEHGQLGTQKTVIEPEALSDKNTFPDVPEALRNAKVVEAACGRAHTLLVTDEGHLYATGNNTLGCCGQSANGDLWAFKRVGGPLQKEHVVMASAGISFSLALTQTGKVFAFGSPEKGQLGHGKTGEYIAASRTLFQEEPTPYGKNIVQIASGQQHSLALDDEGYVYSWGSGALGRLGHGKQMDSLTAQVIDAFTHPLRINRATKITCGSTNSIVLDGQRMIYLFGKFKTTGDGSSQPWMTPRTIQDVQSYKMKLIGAGGATIFAVADEGNSNLTVAIGQACSHGELGLGVGEVKSATKPTRVLPLEDLEIIDLAAGQNTTFFLIRPPAEVRVTTDAPSKPTPSQTQWDSGWGFASPAPKLTTETSAAPIAAETSASATNPTASSSSFTQQEAWESLPRFPPVLEPSEVCIVCNEEKPDIEQLECDKCEEPFHITCLGLEKVPDGEWFCESCISGRTTSVAANTKKPSPKSKAGKRKAEVDSEDEQPPTKKKTAAKTKRKSK